MRRLNATQKRSHTRPEDASLWFGMEGIIRTDPAVVISHKAHSEIDRYFIWLGMSGYIALSMAYARALSSLFITNRKLT